MGKSVSFENRDKLIQIGITIATLRRMRGMSQENLADKAEEGMEIAQRIDSYVRVIKKGNIVRKSLNLKA